MPKYALSPKSKLPRKSASLVPHIVQLERHTALDEEGRVDLDEITPGSTLDSIGDGTTYGKVLLTNLSSGNVDHGSISGLSDDDHPQYVKDSEFTQVGGILVGTGAGTFQEETGATVRSSIGLGSIATQNANSVSITGGSISGLSSLGVSGNITVTGTVDGRDIATDGSKLDGIETSADVTDFTNVSAALAAATSAVGFNSQSLNGINRITLTITSSDVSNPPTDAELDALWTGPGTVGAGWSALLQDSAGTDTLYLVVSDGTFWWTFTGVKAV